jgi:hypothetical protein
MVQKWDIFTKFSNPVWDSRYFGFRGINSINGLYRYIHNCIDGKYDVGRHSTSHPFEISDKAIILWFGFSPFNLKSIKRKLQIKSKIPESDFLIGHGFQHNINFFGVIWQFILQHKKNKVVNLKNQLKKYV